ncbi:MAG: FtsW/RodA/SpoVE family cell cycle protein [Elusimicrobia bacterium]|nr:FtsW/RodA/SpoVE family cell cycle protein [Elusimicrobiota bacterium]
MLLVTLIFGTRLRGSRSWLDLGPVYFQPVEVVRLALAAALAAYADRRYREVRQWAGPCPCWCWRGFTSG